MIKTFISIVKFLMADLIGYNRLGNNVAFLGFNRHRNSGKFVLASGEQNKYNLSLDKKYFTKAIIHKYLMENTNDLKAKKRFNQKPSNRLKTYIDFMKERIKHT